MILSPRGQGSHCEPKEHFWGLVSFSHTIPLQPFSSEALADWVGAPSVYGQGTPPPVSGSQVDSNSSQLQAAKGQFSGRERGSSVTSGDILHVILCVVFLRK